MLQRFGKRDCGPPSRIQSTEVRQATYGYRCGLRIASFRRHLASCADTRSRLVQSSNSAALVWRLGGQRRVLSILGRSFSVALKAGERLQIAAIERWGRAGGLPVHVAAVDQSLKVESRGSFDPDYMKALYAAGEAEATRGQAFADNVSGIVPTNRAER